MTSVQKRLAGCPRLPSRVGLYLGFGWQDGSGSLLADAGISALLPARRRRVETSGGCHVLAQRTKSTNQVAICAAIEAFEAFEAVEAIEAVETADAGSMFSHLLVHSRTRILLMCVVD